MSPSLLVRACCTALLLAAGTNARSTHPAQGTDAAPVTSELIEANEKAVNEVYLATIGKDVDGFTTTQANDLFAIANWWVVTPCSRHARSTGSLMTAMILMTNYSACNMVSS
ncbi:MAG: hypothetical protein HUU33_15280 [Flavobacteriales bacterium]|nr:hypothetical protein [Flavobacteriales bacterium]